MESLNPHKKRATLPDYPIIPAACSNHSLHNLNSLLSQHLEANILKLELLDLAAAG